MDFWNISHIYPEDLSRHLWDFPSNIFFPPKIDQLAIPSWWEQQDFDHPIKNNSVGIMSFFGIQDAVKQSTCHRSSTIIWFPSRVTSQIQNTNKVDGKLNCNYKHSRLEPMFVWLMVSRYPALRHPTPTLITCLNPRLTSEPVTTKDSSPDKFSTSIVTKFKCPTNCFLRFFVVR